MLPHMCTAVVDKVCWEYLTTPTPLSRYIKYINPLMLTATQKSNNFDKIFKAIA